MAQAEFHEVLEVDTKRFFSVVTNYEEYPKFVDGCKSVNVTREGEGRVRVNYNVNVMSQDVNYTLDLHENSDTGSIVWSLVDSNLFKKNVGRWEIKPAGPGKTDVLYTLDIEFKITVPGFILNRLVKGSLPGMVKSFEKRAQQ